MSLTAAKLLSVRLEKLEKDLQLLTGMQSLLLTHGSRRTDTNGQNCEIPERDTSTLHRRKSKENSKQRCNTEDDISDIGIRSKNHFKKRLETGESILCASDSDHTHYYDNNISLSKPDNLELLETVKLEREKRIELEDSAKRVALKLQKAEDELQRERETKQMLLVGTLQLKNQISGQESHIFELEADVKKLKSESEMWNEKVHATTAAKASIEEKYKELIQALKLEKKNLQAKNKTLMESKTNIELQLEEKKKLCDIQEQNLLSQDQKQVAKMNQMITKCSQLSKERENLALELRSTLQKLEVSDQELNAAQEALKKLQLESEREQMLQDCLLKKLKGDMHSQKQKFEYQIKQSQAIVSKTKSLIIQVRKERDDLRSIIRSCKEETQESQVKLNEAIEKYESIKYHFDSFKEKMNGLVANYQMNFDKIKKENSSLKTLIQTLREEKELQTKLTLQSENEFLKEKAGTEEKLRKLITDNDHLKTEITKVTDSMKILQKVSDDQTKTIQSLRQEKEEQRKLKFSLETELRERDANEAVLARKLDHEQRKSSRLEEAIEEHQAKLRAMEKELEEHNCEDFIESAFKKQLDEIEFEVRSKYDEWQESLSQAQHERDKAIRSARNHQKAAEEVKAEYENQMLEMTNSTKHEHQRLKMECKRLASEKASRMMELEAELEQVKLQSNQIQRSLTGKIQQLQCALNICVTSTTPFGNTGPNSFSNFL